MATEKDPKATLRTVIETKVDRLLEEEERFRSGNKYNGLDLPASALDEWLDRPTISGSIEPFVPREDIRIILIDQIAQETRTRKRHFLKTVEEITRTSAFKNIQLHIAPLGEAPRVKYVYNLILVEAKPAELSYYMDRPVGVSLGDEPAPMMPFGMNRMEATLDTLKAFNLFLEQAKPI